MITATSTKQEDFQLLAKLRQGGKAGNTGYQAAMDMALQKYGGAAGFAAALASPDAPKDEAPKLVEDASLVAQQNQAVGLANAANPSGTGAGLAVAQSGKLAPGLTEKPKAAPTTGMPQGAAPAPQAGGFLQKILATVGGGTPAPAPAAGAAPNPVASLMLKATNPGDVEIPGNIQALLAAAKPQAPQEIDPLEYKLMGLAQALGGMNPNAGVGQMLLQAGIGTWMGAAKGKNLQREEQRKYQDKLAEYNLNLANVSTNYAGKQEARQLQLMSTAATLAQRAAEADERAKDRTLDRETKLQLAQQASEDRRASLALQAEIAKMNAGFQQDRIEIMRKNAETKAANAGAGGVVSLLMPNGEVVPVGMQAPAGGLPRQRDTLAEPAPAPEGPLNGGGGIPSLGGGNEMGFQRNGAPIPLDKELNRTAVKAANPAAMAEPGKMLDNLADVNHLTSTANTLARIIEMGEKDPTLFGSPGAIRQTGAKIVGTIEGLAQLGFGSDFLSSTEAFARNNMGNAQFNKLFKDPNLDVIGLAENYLQVGLAKARDPTGRLLKDQLDSAKTDVKLRGLLLGSPDQVLNRMRGVLQELVTAKENVEMGMNTNVPRRGFQPVRPPAATSGGAIPALGNAVAKPVQNFSSKEEVGLAFKNGQITEAEAREVLKKFGGK